MKETNGVTTTVETDRLLIGWTTLSPAHNAMNSTKIIIAIAMFIFTLVATSAPIIFIKRLNARTQNSSQNDSDIPRWKEIFLLWVGRLSCFAGGVFLSTGFMDLFPDVEEVLQRATKLLELKTTFPFAPWLTLLGFSIILTIEQMILVSKESSMPSGNEPESHINYDHPADREVTTNNVHTEITERQPLLHRSRRSFSCHPRLQRMSSNPGSPDYRSSLQEPLEGISPYPVYRSRSPSVHSVQHEYDVFVDNDGVPDESGLATSGGAVMHSHSHDHNLYSSLQSHNTLRVIILLVAMSVHSIFEGMAVGLSTTEQSVLNLFAALALHKLVIAAGVGLNLATSELSRRILILAAILFSIASPLGVLGGFFVELAEEKYGGGFVMANGVLQGLACGTFFYVVFFEILPHEFNTGIDRLGKVLSLLLGFSLVSVYLSLMPDS